MLCLNLGSIEKNTYFLYSLNWDKTFHKLYIFAIPIYAVSFLYHSRNSLPWHWHSLCWCCPRICMWKSCLHSSSPLQMTADTVYPCLYSYLPLMRCDFFWFWLAEHFFKPTRNLVALSCLLHLILRFIFCQVAANGAQSLVGWRVAV
jgi:hypothetical protein